MQRALTDLLRSSRSLRDVTSSFKEYPADASAYDLLEDCGRGVSATVHRALCKPFDEIVAIKKLNLESLNCNLEEIIHEAQTMKSYNHPAVLSLHTSFVHNQDLWMVMPFMTGGSILHIMKYKFPEGLDEVAIATIMREVLRALEYVHKNGGIHRDVKAGNILVQKTGAVKLGDFGVAATIERGGSWGNDKVCRTTFVGTPCWMAPEVMEQTQGYNASADIWSFGITMLELANGHAPFAKFPPMKVLLMTLQNPPPQLDDKVGKKHFSKNMRDVVTRCLQKDPSRRPTATQLLEHRFFKQARDEEYLQMHLVDDLPSLPERVQQIRAGKAATCAADNDRRLEVSQQEYVKGVSSWNFDLAAIKAQAALEPDDDEGGSSAAALAAAAAPGMPTIPEAPEDGSDTVSRASSPPAFDHGGGGSAVADGSGNNAVALPPLTVQQQQQQRPPRSSGEGGSAAAAAAATQQTAANGPSTAVSGSLTPPRSVSGTVVPLTAAVAAVAAASAVQVALSGSSSGEQPSSSAVSAAAATSNSSSTAGAAAPLSVGELRSAGCGGVPPKPKQPPISAFAAATAAITIAAAAAPPLDGHAPVSNGCSTSDPAHRLGMFYSEPQPAGPWSPGHPQPISGGHFSPVNMSREGSLQSLSAAPSVKHKPSKHGRFQVYEGDGAPPMSPPKESVMEAVTTVTTTTTSTHHVLRPSISAASVMSMGSDWRTSDDGTSSSKANSSMDDLTRMHRESAEGRAPPIPEPTKRGRFKIIEEEGPRPLGSRPPSSANLLETSGRLQASSSSRSLNAGASGGGAAAVPASALLPRLQELLDHTNGHATALQRLLEAVKEADKGKLAPLFSRNSKACGLFDKLEAQDALEKMTERLAELEKRVHVLEEENALLKAQNGELRAGSVAAATPEYPSVGNSCYPSRSPSRTALVENSSMAASGTPNASAQQTPAMSPLATPRVSIDE